MSPIAKVKLWFICKHMKCLVLWLLLNISTCFVIESVLRGKATLPLRLLFASTLVVFTVFSVTFFKKKKDYAIFAFVGQLRAGNREREREGDRVDSLLRWLCIGDKHACFIKMLVWHTGLQNVWSACSFDLNLYWYWHFKAPSGTIIQQHITLVNICSW